MTISRRGFIAALASAAAVPALAQAPGVGDRGGYPAFGPNGRVQMPEPSQPRPYRGQGWHGRDYPVDGYRREWRDFRDGGFRDDGGPGYGRGGYRDSEDYERRRDWDGARRRRMRDLQDD